MESQGVLRGFRRVKVLQKIPGVLYYDFCRSCQIFQTVRKICCKFCKRMFQFIISIAPKCFSPNRYRPHQAPNHLRSSSAMCVPCMTLPAKSRSQPRRYNLHSFPGSNNTLTALKLTEMCSTTFSSIWGTRRWCRVVVAAATAKNCSALVLVHSQDL